MTSRAAYHRKMQAIRNHSEYCVGLSQRPENITHSTYVEFGGTLVEGRATACAGIHPFGGVFIVDTSSCGFGALLAEHSELYSRFNNARRSSAFDPHTCSGERIAFHSPSDFWAESDMFRDIKLECKGVVKREI